MNDSTTKRCTRCGETKPLDCFSKGARFSDGLQPYCRDCMRAYRADRATESGEHVDGRRRQRSLYSPEERYQRQLAYNNARRKKPEARAKEREHVRQRYHADPEYRERVKAWSRSRGTENERRRQERYHSDPEYRQKRRAEGNEANRKHRQTAKGRATNKANWRRWRASKVAAEGSHTAAEWESLCAQYDHRCLACGQRLPLCEDHVIPLVMGGTDDISNIQPLCRPCNSKKGTQTIDYRPTQEVGE